MAALFPDVEAESCRHRVDAAEKRSCSLMDYVENFGFDINTIIGCSGLEFDNKIFIFHRHPIVRFKLGNQFSEITRRSDAVFESLIFCNDQIGRIRPREMIPGSATSLSATRVDRNKWGPAGKLTASQSQPILEKLRNYLLEIQAEVLPKSPEGRAVRYTLKNWTALTRYCEGGDLQIDNNATERAIRGVAVGRKNWMFFGSDEGGKTAAVLRSFVVSVSASESILSSGSKTFSPASPIIPLPGLPSFCRTTGRPPRLDPKTSNRREHASALARPGDSRTLTISRDRQ
jgi:hypothetical protein